MGEVVLDGIRIEVHEPTYKIDCPRRQSRHKTLGGGETVQDFGRHIQDMVISLTATIDRGTWQALDERYRRRGATFAYQDWHGNDMTIFIEKFNSRSQDAQSFTCRMELRVRAATHLVWPYTQRDFGPASR